MERLWSYLRRFGRMTKEMRPAHRTDILTHALVHYGQKTRAKLGREIIKKHVPKMHTFRMFIGKLLVMRGRKAKEIHTIAKHFSAV